MKEIIQTYLQWKATYAQRAAVNYRIWLERLIEICGDKPLRDFDLRDFLKYKQYLERRFNPYTVQFATVVIKNFLQFCKMQNLDCLSPTLIKLPRVFAKSHRAITETEFEDMVRHIPEVRFGDIRDKLIIHLLWDTGMRVSELTDPNLVLASGEDAMTNEFAFYLSNTIHFLNRRLGRMYGINGNLTRLAAENLTPIATRATCLPKLVKAKRYDGEQRTTKSPILCPPKLSKLSVGGVNHQSEISNSSCTRDGVPIAIGRTRTAF